MPALVHAARVVDPDPIFQAGLAHQILEARMHPKPISIDARAPITTCTNKHMPLELSHILLPR
jgi:hypothetical protein